jgi:hypothetical protein
VSHLPAYPSVDLARSLISNPRYTIDFPPNSYNEGLLRAYAQQNQSQRSQKRFLPSLFADKSPVAVGNHQFIVSLIDVCLRFNITSCLAYRLVRIDCQPRDLKNETRKRSC